MEKVEISEEISEEGELQTGGYCAEYAGAVGELRGVRECCGGICVMMRDMADLLGHLEKIPPQTKHNPPIKENQSYDRLSHALLLNF